ncbi:MAG: NPCBM/NEW2 domain-containing protein [Planctomycetes bacterium]|nr:NPCBM/NEW2 domain-containing protein [Planctomycetota bacterium]
MRSSKPSRYLSVLTLLLPLAEGVGEDFTVTVRQRTTDRLLVDGKPFDFSQALMTFGEAAETPAPLVATICVRRGPSPETRKVRATWNVLDVQGNPVHQFTEEQDVGPESERQFHCSVSPGVHAGPFRFDCEFNPGHDAAGSIPRGSVILSQANRVFRVEDFDAAAWSVAGHARLDPASAHSGRFGLRIEPAAEDRERLTALDGLLGAAASKNLAACGDAAQALQAVGLAGNVPGILQDNQVKEAEKLERLAAEGSRLRQEFLGRHALSLPMGHLLPGRPVLFSAWVNVVQPGGRLDLAIASPNQRWTVLGPDLAGQGWRQVTWDLPVYGALHQPVLAAELERNPQAQGAPNYPLRVEALVLRAMADLSVDEITVRTQSEDTESLVQVIAGGEKPSELFFPGDPFHVRVQNTRLASGIQAALRIEVADLAGRAQVSETRPLELAGGGTQEFDLSTQDWPIGVYAARLSASEGDRTLYRNFSGEAAGPAAAGQRMVLYRPETPGLDTFSLAAFLREGDRVELDLGKKYEVIRLQWHNSYPEKRDGIEPREGLWMWHEYDAQIERTASAGKAIIARLGLTPAWASPAGRYDAIHNNDWVGSPFILPERTIAWQRHVYQVVKRYRDIVSVWEIWNEPDEPAFNTTAQEFVERILKPAHKAARSAASHSFLLLGGITKERILPFLRDLIQHRGHEYVDAIGLHPLVDPLSPERAFFGELLWEAHQAAEKAGAGDKLWITELGWNVGRPDDISELEQAQYLVRAFVLARFAGIHAIRIDLHSLQWEEKGSGVLYRLEAEPGLPSLAAQAIKPENAFIRYRLGALAFRQIIRTLGEETRPVAEIYLRDKSFHLARAYLFETADGYLLVVWREEGRAAMPRPCPDASDMMGNPLPPEQADLEISASPITLRMPREDLARLKRRLERLPIRFEDEPASSWKMRLNYFVDVGNTSDEESAGYRVSGPASLVTQSSHYPNSRALEDSGRVIQESESYTLPLRDWGQNDLILRRRVDYEVKDQRCRVSVDGKEAGIWLTPGQDRSRHWREDHFFVPNALLAGKDSVTLTLSAVTGPFTTYELVAGPLSPGRVYLSDLAPLVDTEGWIGLARSDASFLHSPLSLRGKAYAKGLGVHAPSLLVFNLNRQFQQFHFHCGLDDVTEGKGSVLFKVILDGKLLYESRRVDSFASLPPQVLNVSGGQVLQLVVEDGADGKENDVADWADAGLTY